MTDTELINLLNSIIISCGCILAASLFLVPKLERERDQAAFRLFRNSIWLWLLGYLCGSGQIFFAEVESLRVAAVTFANLLFMSSYFCISKAVMVIHRVKSRVFSPGGYAGLLFITAVIAVGLKADFVMRNTLIPIVQGLMIYSALYVHVRQSKHKNRGHLALSLALFVIGTNVSMLYISSVYTSDSNLEFSLKYLLVILINSIVMTVATFSFFLNELIDRKHLDSMTDQLTRVFNRRALDASGNSPAKERFYGSVILCDIDFFKRINDNFGHDAGDKVIQHFTRALKSHVRQDDLLVRYGGEEFLIKLPGTGLKHAKAMATRMCEALRAASVNYQGQSIHYTASFGVFASDGQQSLEQAISAADKLLYKAKQNGRNQVKSSEQGMTA